MYRLYFCFYWHKQWSSAIPQRNRATSDALW